MANEGRTQRVGDQIQRELAGILLQEIQDPRLGMITVNEVKVSRDLAWADVYYTRMDADNAGESAEALGGAAGYIRSLLASRMSLRFVPRLRFHFDATVANAHRMEDLIDRAVQADQQKAGRDRDGEDA